MAQRKGSFQDIVNRRQQAGFIGRDGQLTRFGANLALPVDHPERRFVFSVHGDGGVGKTSLVRRLRQLVEEHGGAAAYVDESVFGVPEAMRAIADDLSRHGEDLGDFTALHDTYRRRRHEVESDPGAPAGAAAFMTRIVVRAGMNAVQSVPVVGGLASDVDPTALAEQADQLRKFLGAKFRRHEDAAILLSPLQVLTPVFVRDLAKVGRRRLLALFFDTYEQTGPILDDWLRSVLDGDYGDLPENLLVTVAGRGPLDRSLWARYLGLLADVPLTPFSDIEARELLAGRGVTDAHVVDVILKVSGRLPLLVAMLAEGRPTDPEAVGDPSGDAVERFLKWENDPHRRALALAAAIPRAIDEDVLGMLVATDDDLPASFAWLRSLPFVTHQAGRCQYHDVVRDAMIRLERRQSPTRWRRLHQKLAAAYGEWAQAASETEAWDDPRWQGFKLEQAYHLLCADPAKALTDTLREVVDACAYSTSTAARWAQMIAQAGDDADAEEVSGWGRRLSASLNSTEYEADIASMTLLIASGVLTSSSSAVALRLRGRAMSLLGRHEEAVADLNHAVELDPDSDRAIARRGETYMALKRYDEALTDFGRAIELDPDYAWAIARRAQAYQFMNRYDEALSDFDRAIELDPDYAWAIASRGQTYQFMKRYDEALTDLDRAIGLDPGADWAFANRGETYRLMKRYDEALSDLDRAIGLDPGLMWAIASRGQTFRLMGRYDEALTDLDRAIELNSDADWAFANRGETYRLMKRYDEALSDLDRAIGLYPDYAWALGCRGETYRLMKRYDQALTDFDRAIGLDPDFMWAIASRGQAFRFMGRYDEALSDFDRAIGLDPGSHWVLANRGETYRMMKRYDEALTDFDRAIGLYPDYAWALGSRGETYRMMKRYDEALTDFDRAVELDPEYAWAFGSRGQAFRLMGRYGEALTDLDRAIELDPEAGWAVCDRGETYRLMNRYDEALVDFDRAIALDPDYAWAVASRGQTHQSLGRYGEALADIDRALELRPDYDWAVATRGQIHLSLERYGEALADFDRALALDVDPEDGSYRYLRALALFGLGHGEEARTELRTATATVRVQPWPDSDLQSRHLALVLCLAALGEFDGARAEVEEALSCSSLRYLIDEAISSLRDVARIPGTDAVGIEALIARLSEPAS